MFLLERNGGPVPHDPSHKISASDSIVHLKIPSNRLPGSALSVRYRLDQRSDFLQLDHWWLYVSTPVGLTCYPELRALLANAQAVGLHAVLEKLEELKLITFVAFAEDSESVYFGRSLDGFCSLFFSKQASRLTIADSRQRVAESLGHTELSKQDEEAWCERAYLDPESSFYERVSRCFAGVRYCVDTSAPSRLTRHLMGTNARPLNQAASACLLHQGLLDAFSNYGDKRVALRLSGGVDSRVLLVGLMEAVKQGILRKDQILCVSVLFPGLECDESDEIQQITRKAGFETAGIVATSENVNHAYSRTLELPAPPFPTSFMGALCMAEARNRGVEIVLSGHGGDEIFDFDLIDVLGAALSDRLRGIQLIRQLRNVNDAAGEFRAVASALLGRRALHSTLRQLLANGLKVQDLRAHRLGRRLLLAQGSGYEMSACNSAADDLLIDAPLLRGPYFDRFDPASHALANGDCYKVVAFDYMQAHESELAALRTRKAAFDALFNSHLRPTRQKCDQLDQKSSLSYATSSAYSEWRLRLSSLGN